MFKVIQKTVYTFKDIDYQPPNEYGATKELVYFELLKTGLMEDKIGFTLSLLPELKWMLRCLYSIKKDHFIFVKNAATIITREVPIGMC